MHNPLPPAAPPEPKAPSCHICTSYAILWSHRNPAPYCLTQLGIAYQFICEKCALHLAERYAGRPGHPTVDAVRAHIAQQQERVKTSG